MVAVAESSNYAFYRARVDQAIRDAGLWGDDARAIVYAVIITETSKDQPKGWKNYTNPRVPASYGFTPNDGDPPSASWSTQLSVGLFQQQPWWAGSASPVVLMDPYISTTKFLMGVPSAHIPGLTSFAWRSLTPWAAAQRVQGSEFSDGSNYLQSMPLALGLVNETPAADWWSQWFGGNVA